MPRWALWAGLAVWLWAAANTAAPGPDVALAALAQRFGSGEGFELAAGTGAVGSPSTYSGPTSGRLSLEEVTAVAASTGLRGEALATAVAIAGWDGSPSGGESHGRSCAQGDQHLTTGKWGNSVGLWQVRSLAVEGGTGGTRDADRLCDPAFNARSMHSISNGGRNWRPWSVFTSGKHQPNLDQARTAAAAWG